MYLNGWDLVALFIALSSSVILVVTTAIANARLTRSRDVYRKAYYDVTAISKRLLADAEKQDGWDDCTDQHCQKCHCAECD